MTPERFRQLESLYDQAAALEPAERARFLEECCADDPELRRELIAAFDDSSSGLTGAVEAAAAAAVAREDNWSGRRVGNYRIVRPLGRGGMGAVYLAVRDDDEFRKEVALKTLKFELEGGREVARFRRERQILAELEHPNIARLLDGGATEQGTPYIILEYVPGIPITEWCGQNRLSVEHRLRLFRQVCDAVRYAHQHLVVHRDLKPGNILVTPEGVPKLLDFGIAKLLDPAAEAAENASVATLTGVHLMTPDYASPEQVRGDTISTATDVYSLGAVLYELLTGERPYPLQKYDAVEIARTICDSEVRPPSSHGNRLLRGDLDVIVLKAMQKDPTRRYASVAELSDDIRRHLEGRPIAARPDSTAYRAGKFVRRHWIGVSATAVAVASLAVGLAVSVHQARIAQRRFDQVRELANTFLFQFYDQVTRLPGSTGVRASIVDTARKYLDGLAAEAGSDKGLTFELAQAYQRLGLAQGGPEFSLGRPEDARRSYQRSLELYARLPVRRSSPAEWRRGRARTLMSLGNVEYTTYHEVKAAEYDREALTLLDDGSAEGATRFERAWCLRLLGQSLLRMGAAGEAQSVLESSRRLLLELQASGFTDESLTGELESTIRLLGRAKVLAGDLDGGLNDFLELLRRTPPCDEKRPAGADCRQYALRLDWTADIYAAVDRPNLGETEKAAVLYDQTRHIHARIAAEDPQNRQARFDMASATGKLGDAIWKTSPTRAIELYDEALAAARELASKEQFEMLLSSYQGAITRPLIQLGRTAEARKALTEALREADSDPNPAYADRLGTEIVSSTWADLLWAERKPDEARKRLRQSIAGFDKLHAEHPGDLTPVFYISMSYRKLASMTAGSERRQTLLSSAAAWHSWPATSYTHREEQKDLLAAAQVK